MVLEYRPSMRMIFYSSSEDLITISDESRLTQPPRIPSSYPRKRCPLSFSSISGSCLAACERRIRRDLRHHTIYSRFYDPRCPTFKRSCTKTITGLRSRNTILVYRHLLFLFLPPPSPPALPQNKQQQLNAHRRRLCTAAQCPITINARFSKQLLDVPT